MPKKYGNRIKVNSATTGTGVISLGTAVEGYQNFSSGGITDGSSVSYVIEDGANFEIGVGTYTASGTTLSRTVSESTNSNNAINLSGEAVIFITPAASDLPFTDGASFSGAVTFAEDVTFASANYNILFDKSQNSLEFADNAKATFGDSRDLQIYHDGNSVIRDDGSGDLELRGSNTISLMNAAGTEYKLRAYTDGAVNLYYDNAVKLATSSSGVNVTGTVTDDGAVHDGDVTFTGASYSAVWDKSDSALEFADNAKATFGSSRKVEIYSNGTMKNVLGTGTGSLLVKNSGDIYIQDSSAGTKTYIAMASGGSVELYTNGIKKFETSSSGVNVIGNIAVSGTVDGRDLAVDGQKLDGITAGANVGVPTTGGTFTGAVTFSSSGNEFSNGVTFSNQNTVFSSGAQFTSGNITVGNNDTVKLVMGGSSLQIGGNSSYYGSKNIIDSGLDLKFLMGNTKTWGIYEANASDKMMEVHEGGGIDLYYNRSKKLEVTNTGVTVTGTLAATAVTGDGSGLTNLPAGASNVGTGNFIGGTNAGAALQSGALYNTLLGNNAGNDITTGDKNTVVGTDAGTKITTASSNTFFGYRAGENATGAENTIVGQAAGYALTTGTKNTIVGHQVGTSNITGNNNTLVGAWQTGDSLTSGTYNVLLGGGDVTTGSYNTLIARGGLSITTGSHNFLVGESAGSSITTGGYNILFGAYAGSRRASGSASNIAMGYNAFRGGTTTSSNTGTNNLALGNSAGYAITSGNSNVLLGKSAGETLTSGANNVAVGVNAGDNITSGSRNIVIGQGADASSATASNEITIGSQNHTSFRMPGLQQFAANGSVLQYNSATGLIGLSALQTDLIYDASPQLGGNLDTRTHNINFPQLNNNNLISNYLSFGGKFYFVCQQGYNRIISDSSSTGFEIKGNVMKLMTATNNENYLVATKDGSVELYYDNSKKFETTSTGVDITGTLTSDGLTVQATGANYPLIEHSSGNRIQLQPSYNYYNSFQHTFKNLDGSANTLTVGQTGDISFYEDTGTTAKFFWDASAESLGIGNSTPSNNHANANNLVVGNGTAGGIANYVGTGLGWYAFSRSNANNSDAFDGGISYDGSRNLMFHTNSGSERMRISSDGSVGINDISPDGKLNVVSTAHNNGSIFDSTGTTQLWLRDTDAASNQKNWGFQVSGGSLNILRANDDRASGFVTPIEIQQAPANSLVINSSGNLLVGALSGSDKVTVNGTVSATNFNSTSDATLKTNVKTLNGSLDAVMSMRGVSFDWVESGATEIGVIAQEVEEVVPDVVNTNGEGIKSVKYGNLVGVLIEAIKEQQTQIDELKDQVKKLNG